MDPLEIGIVHTQSFFICHERLPFLYDVHKESRSLRKHVSEGRICVVYIVVILWPLWTSWLCIVRIIPGFYCVLSGVTCQHTSKLITGTHSVYGKLVEEWSSSKFLGADAWDWWWPSWWMLTTGSWCLQRFPAMARMSMTSTVNRGLTERTFIGRSHRAFAGDTCLSRSRWSVPPFVYRLK